MSITKKYQLLAFHVFKPFSIKYKEYFYDLGKAICQANLKTTLEVYLSQMFLSSVIAFCITFVLTFFILKLLYIYLSPFAYIFILAVSLLGGTLTFLVLYYLPTIMMGERKRKLEADLPYAATNIGAVASSGAPPLAIFRSLAEFKRFGEVSEESEEIMQNITAFGKDIATAIIESANKSPSEKFKDFMLGLVATIRASGDLNAYLKEQARVNIEERRRELLEFSDVLAVIAEIFIGVVVIGPIFLVIMLSLMGSFGEYAGILPIKMILQLLIYVLIPIASIVFMIIIDTITPKK